MAVFVMINRSNSSNGMTPNLETSVPYC